MLKTVVNLQELFRYNRKFTGQKKFTRHKQSFMLTKRNKFEVSCWYIAFAMLVFRLFLIRPSLCLTLPFFAESILCCFPTRQYFMNEQLFLFLSLCSFLNSCGCSTAKSKTPPQETNFLPTYRYRAWVPTIPDHS